MKGKRVCDEQEETEKAITNMEEEEEEKWHDLTTKADRRENLGKIRSNIGWSIRQKIVTAVFVIVVIAIFNISLAS